MALARPKTSPSISLACLRSSNRLDPRELPLSGSVLIRLDLYQSLASGLSLPFKVCILIISLAAEASSPRLLCECQQTLLTNRMED